MAATAVVAAVAKIAMPIAIGASACEPPPSRNRPKPDDWMMARKPQTSPAAATRRAASRDPGFGAVSAEVEVMARDEA